MEVAVKNAIIYHGDNILQLNTMNTEKFGAYKNSVIIMLTVVKAVVNGLKHETEPAVLINGMVDNITKQLSINESVNDDGDILEKIHTEVKTVMQFLINMNDETIERRKLCDTRYNDAKALSDSYLKLNQTEQKIEKIIPESPVQ